MTVPKLIKAEKQIDGGEARISPMMLAPKLCMNVIWHNDTFSPKYFTQNVANSG
jgi:hypothetical protein